MIDIVLSGKQKNLRVEPGPCPFLTDFMTLFSLFLFLEQRKKGNDYMTTTKITCIKGGNPIKKPSAPYPTVAELKLKKN